MAIQYKYKVGDMVILDRHQESAPGKGDACWNNHMEACVGKKAYIKAQYGICPYQKVPKYLIDVDGMPNMTCWWRETALTPYGSPAQTISAPAVAVAVAVNSVIPDRSDLDFFASVSPGMCKCGMPKHQCDYHK